MDTLQEQRKNKKEMEFELKLAKEKEEMYEREKQLKISRLVQEVWRRCLEGWNLYVFEGLLGCSKLAFRGFGSHVQIIEKEELNMCDCMGLCQVSETEREDLEESEKVQHWVERLCQTRLEQISCVENESPEVLCV